MPNSDKNPYPNDIPKEKPPHSEEGNEWTWDPSDELLGVNPSTKSEFDNENTWPEEGYTDEHGKRSYVGKHLDHKYPHISIHNKNGTLVAKDGYLYRLFNCEIEELSAEGAAIVYCRDCKIDKLTGTAPGAKARFHFTDCEIKDVVNVTNYHMFFDRNTEFKAPEGAAQFNNINNSNLIVYSTPDWTLTGKKHMNSFSGCDIVISGPSRLHNIGSSAMHSGFSNCNYVTMGQWLATGVAAGCTQDVGPKVFEALTQCDFINLNTQINNPEVGSGMYVGMSECNVTNINPNFVVHAGFFSGEQCNISSIGGSYENCDVIHFHVKDSTACCVNTEITGSPGAGSMLQDGVSDGSSLVVAGGKVDVTDNAAPVFAATNCSMRFYDCEKVTQNGSQDLFSNLSNCVTRVFYCEEVKAVVQRVFNEKADCRVDALKNTLIKSDNSDVAMMGENSVLTIKMNEKLEAKKKVVHLTNKSALFTQRNGLMKSEDEQVLVIMNKSHANLNQDTKLYSEGGDVIVDVAGESRLISQRTWMKGDVCTYGLRIAGGSIVELERDKVESNTHVVKIDDSKLFSKWQEFIAIEHLGIIGASSFIDIMKGSIDTHGEEFSLGQCEGTIKNVLLLGPKEIIFKGGNSFFIFDQNTQYIYMESEDEIECEKLEVEVDVIGKDCIFKVRDGSIDGDLTIANKEVWLHNVTVGGATVIASTICKLFGGSFTTISVSGGMLQTGENKFTTASYSSDLGLISKDTYSSLSCVGVYILNGVSGGSISVSGLAFYQNCPDVLSLPYKKGVYSSDNLDLYAENNIKMWAVAGDMELQAGLNILSNAAENIEETAGGDIKEVASGIASTNAAKITHN